MRLFTINQKGEMLPYDEHDFKKDNCEQDLEDILERNPQYFFKNSNILIIGRQITTNLSSIIDLLGVDKKGNSIVIELKRDNTPRDTIAQILEYASFVENLDYEQINAIFRDYYGVENELEEYHREYFSNDISEKVSFNKNTKLLIVAHNISREVKQTASYLRKSGLDIYCLEFKYFKTKSGEKIISSDFVVGEDEYKRQEVRSSFLPRVNKSGFLKELDVDGRAVFERLFEFAESQDFIIVWGSKGFSLNVQYNGENVSLLFGYPPSSVFKQSIYTGFESIIKKVNNSHKIVSNYRSKLLSTGYFIKAGENIKWIINKRYSEKDVDDFIKIVREVSELIKKGERGNGI